MFSTPNNTKIERLDSIDLAIVILIWGTVIAYFMIASEIVTGLKGSVLRYSCVGYAALVGVIKLSKSRPRIPREMVVLLIFIFIAFTSVFFSIERIYTFARATNTGMLFLFLLGVYSAMESK